MNAVPTKNKSLDIADLDLDLINDSFVNFDTPVFPAIPPPVQPYRANPDTCFYFRGVDQCDVVQAVLSVKSNAVGLDKVHPTFLKAVLPIVLPHITYIFNYILASSVFPASWKQARVVPVPKPSGGLRPIAVLPLLSKALEKIMHSQMTLFLDQHNMLNSYQSGFRKEHSCITALLDVIENIRSQIDANKVCVLTLLDHTKAFDSVEPVITCTKLSTLFNFSASATELIKSYLTGRSQRVSVNNCLSEPLNVMKGVPQGSILGPLLFNMYINDLPDILQDCNIHIYADDIQVYMFCSTNSIPQCISNLNSELNRILEWATINHLCINPQKSKCLLISKKSFSVSELDPPCIGGQDINFCDTAKNLGITFDRTLSWNIHISVVVGKVYGMLRLLWSTQDFTPFHIRLLLSKVYLIPTLLYGCEIFANADQASKQKLNVLFNNIARYIFKRHRYDHISEYSKKIFGYTFDNLINLRTLTTLHKIIFSHEPAYLYRHITFSQSSRNNKIIIPRHRALLSERQFFVHSARLWNLLPIPTTLIQSTNLFKKTIVSSFD